MSDEEWIRLGSQINEARKYYEIECYEKAIELYLSILNSSILKYHDRATVMTELGYCYYEIDEYDQAIKVLTIAKELDEFLINNSGFCRTFGNCLFQLGKYSEAIGYQKQALNNSQSSEEKKLLLFLLGRSYLFMEDGKSALKYLKMYLKKLSVDDIEDRLDATFNIGYAYIQMKKSKDAEKAFKFLIKHNRDHVDIAKGYYGLAELNYRNGNYSLAKEYGQKVLDVYPNYSGRETILYFLIMIAHNEKRLEEMIDLGEKFIDEYPNSKFRNEVKALL